MARSLRRRFSDGFRRVCRRIANLHTVTEKNLHFSGEEKFVATAYFQAFKE
jgi:hypothetical protein